MDKIVRTTRTISVIVACLVSVPGLIYEYIIWDKSLLSDTSKEFFDVVMIIGFIAMLVLGLTFIVEKINDKIKSKKK